MHVECMLISFFISFFVPLQRADAINTLHLLIYEQENYILSAMFAERIQIEVT